MTQQGDQRVFQSVWRAEREAREAQAVRQETAPRPCRPEGRLYE